MPNGTYERKQIFCDTPPLMGSLFWLLRVPIRSLFHERGYLLGPYFMKKGPTFLSPEVPKSFGESGYGRPGCNNATCLGKTTLFSPFFVFS